MTVTDEHLAESPLLLLLLLNEGWRPVYCSPLTNSSVWMPASRAVVVSRLLQWRDRLVRAFGRHCLEIGVIKEGEMLPLPRWVCLGWWP